MTARPSVSVIIVSRDRPQALRRAVLGVSQLVYSPFELIVVSDAAGCAALSDLDAARSAKIHLFEEANISAARNLGLAHAAGDIVAYIDDDAVPETGWLHHLVAGFATEDVLAATGVVIGRNGITSQWGADWVDATGQTNSARLSGAEIEMLRPCNGQVARTQGTNMAFRRDAIVKLGGFDTRYRFFLEDTDLNLRLNAPTAFVPRARVHHGFLASPRRRRDRVPQSLFEIGASWSVFMATHCTLSKRNAAQKKVWLLEWHRLQRHLVDGRLEPRDVSRLMGEFDAGFEEGRIRRNAIADRPLATSRLLHMPERPALHDLHAGSIFDRHRLQKAAEHSLKEGRSTTVLCLSPSALFHRVRFTETGAWLHTGGQYGKMHRRERLFHPHRLTTRVTKIAEEMQKSGHIGVRYINPQ